MFKIECTHDLLKLNKEFSPNAWFAGGLWSWTGFAPHNVFSIKATEVALKSCIENGVSDVLLTLWGDNGGECSRFALLPALFYASEIAKGNDESLIKQKFEQKIEMVVKTLGLGAESVCVETQGRQAITRVKFAGGREAAMIFAPAYPFTVCVEDGAGKNIYRKVESDTFNALLKDILHFFETGEKSFDGAQTLEVMKIREAVIKAKSEAGVWIKI